MAQKIKSFIYLDEYKMYSISSQMSGGITDYLMSHKKSTTEEAEEQKGPVGSGRVVGDTLKSESGIQEKKHLHDYNYTLFEEELNKSGKILSISAEDIDEKIEQIGNAGFVKVTGKVVFNDMNIIKSTMENFNEIGQALAYVSNFEKMEEVRSQLEKAAENTTDRNQKAKIRHQLKNITNIEKLAKDQGLKHDQNFLDNLNLLLNYGFQDQFTVQMPIGQYTFSADCKRDDFREDEPLLVRKYSRFAEKEFVIVGTVAQSSNKPIDYQKSADYEEVDNEDSSSPHFKEVIMNLVEALSVVESEFTGKLENEIIIDPIAIYREI
ncbi:MAG: hypothetical protein OXM61_02220 [Candidatus Poribacteria bacterium]|nr:hypothetical protein [Candidatus Poribacteria bacterium]